MMADIIQSTNDIDTIFADFVQNVLGMREDRVLISYQEKGQRSYRYNEDVCFIHTENSDSEIQRYKNRTNEYNEESDMIDTIQSSIRIVSIQVVFYGQNNDQLVTSLFEKLFFESSREYFAKNNLFLIPTRTQIMPKVHEKVNERWWDRIDLNVGFYNTVRITENKDIITDLNYNIDVEVQR